jgi:AP-1 complex subunit beta-1
MSDSAKYFGTQKRGEIFELKEELLVSDIAKKRDAVKKVIAAMTVGKDVSSLFTDVLNCMMTSNVEIKKLVYLYIMNYASSNPDLCILAVNAFVKDAGDMANPMLRALSVRTMGCIRVEKITEYLCEPLRKCLKDEDPYVRKTAAVCVAKLYDISPDLVEVQGFLDDLRKMLGDSNPMVVANSVAALSEIAESGKADAFEVTHTILQKLLAALNECTEWGQVFILDALAFYTPSDEREAESIIDRVSPRLQHANSAVVLSSTKVILHNLDSISNNDTIKAVTKKLAPPLVTLLSSESEIQYVALRNINLIVQKRPSILSHEVKVFFCKYNDPIYVKMEKLEIMVMLASERNVEQVLLEFKEYATEVDVEFVRRSVRAIGRCAIKLEGAAERCINVLLDLITTKVNYVVQEAIVVIKDIFRKYPNRYEAIIGTLCENLDTLDEPEAKASMIWIIGEYAERIDNAGELMEQFLETFADESVSVQLQLLTATVKLFLKQPNGTQEMVQRVLQLATQGSDNPDLRDRGFVYWRLLSTDPEAAKAVVLAEKPTIHDDSGQLAPDILDQLLKHLSTLASVYHRLPETFVSRVKVANQRDDDDDEEDGSSHHAAPATHSQAAPNASGGAAAAPPPKQVDLMSDLFGDSPAPAPAASATVHHAPAPAASLLDDLMGGFGAPAPAPAPQASNLPVICTAQQGKGMEIKGHLVRRNGETVYDFVISNQTQQPLSGFAIQFNKNLFSVMPGTIPAITGSFIDATRALSFARVSLASSFSPTRQLTLVNLCPHLSASSSATRRRQ